MIINLKTYRSSHFCEPFLHDLLKTSSSAVLSRKKSDRNGRDVNENLNLKNQIFENKLFKTKKEHDHIIISNGSILSGKRKKIL